MGTDVCVLERTARISNLRQLAGMELAAFGDNDLVCIGVHDEIGIVGDDDDLAALLRLTKEFHKLIENRLLVQILLGLIDNERAIIFDIDRKIEEQ